MEEIIEIHLKGQVNLYFSNILQKENYDIYYSNIIDDEFWNFAFLKKSEANLKKIFEDIKVNMNKLNRKPIIYITSNIMDSKLQQEIESSDFKLLYTDVWMNLRDLNNFKNYKSKIDFSIYKVDESLKEEFIEAIMNGFSRDNPNEPYENLDQGYRTALKKSFDSNNTNEYKIIHYLGKKGQEAISTATIIYKGKKAIIYNVTTNKKYQKQGVCKHMMWNIIKELIKLGIDEVCLQTEQGFYPEQIYKKMGFKEIMLGKAYVEEE